MSALRFTLRRGTEGVRLDLSALVDSKLAGLDAPAIERLPLAPGVAVGDVFSVAMGDPADIVIDGGSMLFDRLGAGMESGSLRLQGDAGQLAGQDMTGGRLTVTGDVGRLAASGLRGGMMEVGGNAGDLLGGAGPGERIGMSGGMVVVRGAAGARAGDRLRRGVLVVEGEAGEAAGSRMIAGTLVICGRAGGQAGALMRRGTLVVGTLGAEVGPGFAPTGGIAGVFATLLARSLHPISPSAAALASGPTHRFVGDMATVGRGELWLAA